MGPWPDFAPMLATLATRLPTDDEAWAYEVKWDGYRAIVGVEGDRIAIRSRGGKDFTQRFRELATVASAVNATSAVLDGEIVALDADGRPDFGLIGAGDHSVHFHVFDVLRIDGQDTTGLSYLNRRSLLDQLIEPGSHHRVPNFQVGDGALMLAATANEGLEGVVAKRLDSRYSPGARSRDWIKIKHRTRIDVVIGGFTAGDGHRNNSFGALLVGIAEPDGLSFAGGIGTGFSDATLVELRRRLDGLATTECPFQPPPPREYTRHATWVQPVLHATVEMTELSNDGRIRHGSFIELTDRTQR